MNALLAQKNINKIRMSIQFGGWGIICIAQQIENSHGTNIKIQGG